MRNLLKKFDRRFQLTRPGSVLILVVALLVLMALIGTAFLSSTRVDRYATVQHTNNTEIDLLLEGVKNMAKATIVGSLNDPSLPFPYRPSSKYINSYTNSSNAVVNIPALPKNWDMPDFYHQYTNDPLIGTTANDAWLSPRCPTDVPNQGGGYTGQLYLVVWPCIGEPLTGNTFESPFACNTNGAGLFTASPAAPLTYTDRMTGSITTGPNAPISAEFVPPPTGSILPVPGNLLIPTFASISYPDGSTQNYPAFTLAVPYNGSIGTFTYLAGDADGDGIADCGMFKLPVGPIDGVTYYAGARIIDNSAAVNVNTATSRRYDFSGKVAPTPAPTPIPTRWFTATASAPGTVPPSIYPPNYQGTYNLGCFESNVGLAELLGTYDGFPTDNGGGTLGLGANGQTAEIGNLIQYRLNNQVPATGVPGVNVQPGALPSSYPVADNNTQRTDFEFSTLGDLFDSQIARRPGNPGYAAVGYSCQSFTDTDAAALAYHFVMNNPNTSPAPVELVLHNSLYDTAPNGLPGPPVRGSTNATGVLPGVGSTSYVGTPINAPVVLRGWYADNFDWTSDFVLPNPDSFAEGCMSLPGSLAQNVGQYYRPRRSIFTVDSAVSNLVPQPTLPTITSITAGALPVTVAYSTQPTGTRPYTVYAGAPGAQYPTGMSAITSTLCKTSINTATFPDLWRAFWLSMSGDEGLSPLGTNTDPITNYPLGTDGTTALYDHDLVSGQSIYTGMQFANPQPAAGNGDSSQIKSQDFNQGAGAFWTPSADPQHPQAMFRSTLRDPKNVYYQYPGASRTDSYIEADQMVLLRSAIAAANTMAMRYPAKGTNAANAVNAPIFTYDVPLKATVTGTTQTVWARVFGVTRQPYITEVYANTDVNDGNSKPYVAVELFNPYNQDIDLTNWQLISVDRDPTAVGSLRSPTQLFQFPAGTKILANGYAVLEDFSTPGVTARPTSAGTVPATSTNGVAVTDIAVANLANLIPAVGSYANQELMLMRPLVYAGTEGSATIDQVPVDSYDFTGLSFGRKDSNGNNIADVWHYVRGNATNSSSDTLWDFIYPGRYDASDPTPYAPAASAAPPTITPSTSTEPRNAVQIPTFITYSRRQQGTEAGTFASGGGQLMDPFNSGEEPLITLGDNNYSSSYPVSFPFQYLNGDQPGPTTMPVASNVNMYPFGQFARNSDMLQVPFVGAYLIFKAQPSTPATGGAAAALTAADVANIIEINPLPMDCSFAEDTDVTDDPPSNEANLSGGGISTAPYIWNESVGHFAPVNTGWAEVGYSNDTDNQIRELSPGANVPNATQTIADADPTLAYSSSQDPFTPYKVQYNSPAAPSPAVADSSTQKYWRYRWASRIFDYLTVQNPNDDYSPNVQQNIYSIFNPLPVPPPVAVQNTLSIPAASAAVPNGEDTVPTYGLINLNTAPWRVLSALRICPYDDGEVDATGKNLAMQCNIGTLTGNVTFGNLDGVPDNVRLAQAIANYRDFGSNPASLAASNLSPAQLNTTAYPYSVYKGPFTSIADILAVPAVHNYLQLIDFQKPNSANVPPGGSPEPDAVQGHLSPFDFYTSPPVVPIPTDGVRNDVEERVDLLDRLSNQATVKSDTYTVYIVVQGWRNAGSTSSSTPPQMVSQRRAAFIIDRSGVTPTSSNVKIINVPTD